MKKPPADRGGLWRDGWYAHARRLPSPNVGERPAGATIDLIVLHSISLPPGQYGGDQVQRLFTNAPWLMDAVFPLLRPFRGLTYYFGETVFGKA